MKRIKELNKEFERAKKEIEEIENKLSGNQIHFEEERLYRYEIIDLENKLKKIVDEQVEIRQDLINKKLEIEKMINELNK